jgi:anti-sigma B factor antagonist
VTNADQARAAVLAAAAEGPAVVIIDMSETTFCDSAGVQAIVGAYRQAAQTDIQFMIVAVAVARILTLVGVGDLIPIESTLEAALETSAGVQ